MSASRSTRGLVRSRRASASRERPGAWTRGVGLYGRRYRLATMPATRDWIGMEAAIAARLPGVGGASARPELLARLAEYSNAAVLAARELGALVPSSAECDTAMKWLLRPVFICGHQRSGTTLLQNLLDGHPQLLLLPSEATYFTSFAYVARA